MTRKLTMSAALVLALGFMPGPAHAQQYGPPASGSTSALQFVPATLNLVAGLNGAGYAGDGGLANSATTQFNYPIGIAYDSNGNLFIADGQNYIVRRIDHVTGDISTFAGTPQTFGTSTTYTGPANAATFGLLSGLVIDSSNNVYVADRSNNVVWKITPGGTVSPYAGGGTSPTTCTGSTDNYGDGCLATQATTNNAWGLGIDSSNNIYIADSYNDLVREVNATTGKMSIFAGDVADGGGFGDCSPQGLWVTGTSAPYTPSDMHLCFPAGVAFDSNGNAYIADEKAPVVREITKAGVASVFAGGGSGSCTGELDTFGNGCPPTDVTLDYPSAVYVDPSNRVFFVDGEGSEIRMVDSTNTVSDVMGTPYGELNKASIGEPDTEPVSAGSGFTGAGDGIDGFTMDPDGNLVASDSSGAAVTSAGSSAAYLFPQTEIFTTSTTTSAHATSQFYPPYIVISNPSGVTLNFTGTPAVVGPFGLVTGTGAGTCAFPGSLLPGKFCTVVVSFTPTAGGSPGTKFTGTISIDSNAASSPSVINLAGTGIGTATTSATLTAMGGGSLLTYTSAVDVQSAAQQAVLTNTGQTAIAIGSYQTTGGSAAYFSVTGTTCPVSPATLAVGDSCDLSVAFTPNAATTFSAGLQVCISTASYGCLSSVVLNGTGTPATTATATPVITPAAGTYNSPVEVEIADSNSSATIYYTTNGDTPTTTNSTVYSGPFQLPVPGAQVQAIATSTGNPNSAVASSTFTVQPFLDFSNAAVGVATGSAPQLTARFSLLGNTPPTAAAHYGHDYTLGAVSCTTSGAIEVCTVPVTFIPTLPGGRRDALFLMNGTTRVATALLYGIGQAPMSEVQPGIVTSPITSFAVGYIYNSIVDENGTVYFLATEANAVYSLTKGGTPTLVPITGLNSPRSISIDGAGVLYISDQTYNASMTTYDTVQGVQGTVTLPTTSYWQFSNVDGIGDLFVNSSNNNSIYELKTDGTTTDTVIDPAITGANNSTVDGAGDLFIGGYAINELTPAGVQTQINTVGAGDGMGTDAAGTVYATRYTGFGGVVELPAADYATALANLDPASSPLGMSVGSDGTVWVGNYTNLDKVDRTQGAIAFGEQTAGTPSAPMDISVYNSGNENLTLSNIVLTGASSGFAIQTAASDNCTNGIAIAPGALCQIAVTLTAPHAGMFTGTITLTTNSLSNASTTQTVALSGFVYGIYVTESPNPLNFPNQTTNTTSSPMSVTLTNNGDLYDAGIGTPVASSSAFTVGLGTCTAAVAPGGTCQLSVTFDPSLAQAYDSTVTLSASSNGGGPNQTVTFNVTGTGTSAAPTATLTGIAFGNQTEGVASTAKTATLADTSTTTSLSISGITTTGTNAADFQVTTGTGSCGTSVAASTSCPIYITFTPSTTAAESAILNVADNATGSPQTATLTGTGTATAPIATLSLATLNFGGVQIDTTSPALVETVTNTGGGTLTLSAISITQTGTNAFFMGTGANPCTTSSALTAGQSCNVYVTFDPSVNGHTYTGTLNLTNNATGSPQSADLTGVGDYFYEPVASSTSSEPVSVFITTAGTLASTQVVTNGVTTQDYVVQTGGTCANGTAYTVGQLCTVDVVFTPVYPGSRSGSLFLTDAQGHVLGTTFLQGTGTSPEVIFGSPTPQSVTGYLTGLVGVAIDGNDDVFYVNSSDKVIEQPPTGSAKTVADLSTLLSDATPNDITMDPSGNLFIASNTTASLIEIPSTGPGTWGTAVAINTGSISNVGQVGTDGLGNLYITSPVKSEVLELAFTGKGYAAPVVLPFPGSGAFLPGGVWGDGYGDVYAIGQDASTGKTEVITLPLNNIGQFGTAVTTVITQIVAGDGVAADANGDLYVSGLINSTNGAIYFLPGTNSGYGTPVLVGTGLYGTFALDGASNLFAAQANLSDQAQVVELPQTTSPILQFAQTEVGQISTDSPKTASVWNVGNEALYFNNVVYATDFPVNNNDTSLCNNEFPLNPGAECDVSADFMPTVPGLLSEDETLTDDNLNGDSVQQLVPVVGSASAVQVPVATLTPPSLNFGSLPVGTTSSPTGGQAILGNSGGAQLNMTISITGPNAADFAITTGNLQCGTTLAVDSTCFIWVTFTPSVVGPETATLNVTDNAAGSPQTVALSGTGTGSTSGTAVLTLTPATINFGEQVGASGIQPFTLSNAGPGSATNLAINISATREFQLSSGGTCGTTLAEGASCTINVTFNAVAPPPALYTTIVSVSGNAENTPIRATEYGIGDTAQLQYQAGLFMVAAGTPGKSGESGDGGRASAAELSGGDGIMFDATGNAYFSDAGSNVVREINSGAGGDNDVNIVAGTPSATGSYGGDDGPATSANLNGPHQLAFDGFGDLYIADTGNNIIRLVAEGSIITYAGSYGTGEGDFGGDGGPATSASMNAPQGVAVDIYGNLYIADTGNDVIREVSATTGIINTIAGKPGVASHLGDNGAATNATLNAPQQVALDPSGDLFIADTGNNVVREILTSGKIITIAGGGSATVTATPIGATTAKIDVQGVAVDAAGDLYIAGTNAIYFVDENTGNISLIGGGGTSFTTNIPATSAQISPGGLAIDPFGGVWVNDPVNHVIDTFGPDGALQFGNVAMGQTSAPLTLWITNVGNENFEFQEGEGSGVVRGPSGTLHATGRKMGKQPQPGDQSFGNGAGSISGDYALTGGSCDFDTMQTGATCSLQVTFTPTVVGPDNGTLTLTDDNGNEYVAQLDGTGTGATAPTATLTGISFGNVTEGTTSAAMSATLTNTSTTTALTISSITITGTNGDDFTKTTGTGACGASLAANTSCQIYATFTPSLVGAETATLSVNDNATGSPQTAALTGTGTAPPAPVASLSPTTLAFGNQAVNTSSAVMTTTLSNTGTGVLNIVGIYLNEPSEGDVVKGPQASAITISSSPDYAATTTCGATLAAGATCTISVTFDPQSTGSLPGTLSVSDNASNSPQTATLTGTGVTQGNFTVASPTPPQTVLPGKTASYTINVSVTPNGDIFNNPVTLSATGLPAGATASFSPVSVTPGTSTATSTMTVQTAAYNALLAPASSTRWPIPSLALMFGGAWALFRRKHRERFARLLTLMLLLGGLGAATMGLMGCGGGFDKNTLPPAKTYTIIVTGTSGEQTQTTTVQLTVE